MTLKLESVVLQVCAKCRAHVFERTGFITWLQEGNFGTIFQHSISNIEIQLHYAEHYHIYTANF